jgi:uncharacterized protein
MKSLYQDNWLTFRFAEERIIPRFHLEGVPAGRQVSVIKIDPNTGERMGLLAMATAGVDGWVDLSEPIIVRAGDAFIAVPVTHQLTLTVLPDTLAVCKLDKDAPIPGWASSGDFVSITRTAEELSVVCRQEAVPDGVQCERSWRCLRVASTLDFSLVGVLASMLDPLAEAGISVFAISTFDTDYLLVKEESLQRAVEVLRGAGHVVA